MIVLCKTLRRKLTSFSLVYSVFIFVLLPTLGFSQNTSCPGFRTQTPGGWGAVPRGNNPATYLYANFTNAFPRGLAIGCTDSLLLTSAQHVTNFLPSGSTPSALPSGKLTDPPNYRNVFAGHVVALTLSVTFDLYDTSFGTSSSNLKDLVIRSGTFTGWTVEQLLAEGELKFDMRELPSGMYLLGVSTADMDLDQMKILKK